MASASDAGLSHEERWTAHRADREADSVQPPSEASTPAPTTPATPPTEELASSQEFARPKASTLPSSGLGIDAEDEDVRIAIMALGAMKSLDGTSAGFDGASTSSSAMSLDQQKRISKCKFRSGSTSTQSARRKETLPDSASLSLILPALT